ncbi:nitrate ABC transporter permease [Leucobacter sp. OLIS6]|uniref:ABC transporter permease n=1 Tax=unclassified Leucobacter TaxID=2621730 RepID=UPI000C1A460F|nr:MULTISPECIES: ABC transporter permease subunit [unclassified Leucobacter]PII99020.1 nitrate ABC transporter permease [Leucobacter sp. OLES1]PII83780.1 nitrate ABC transporter permease [Leucobacter sp. OLCALW19]PII89313.1 nitrate ABC transporter permease [Leucobacter sp. OLTLW20]PII90690.1 nitrate ABC transporter permease [Leucobacter sp. OLAS13]PII99595.1 nitrate ABC transporter permease [Leucobacter sp. OLDS2]
MRASRLLQIGIGALGVVAALGLWQLAATTGPLADSPLPAATDAIAALFGLLGSPDMWAATWDTVAMAFAGLVIAAVAGILLGIGIGVSPLAMHATRIPLEFLKPIPPIVILPIVVLVLGPTAGMGIFLVFIGCFVSIVVQASAGVFDTDPVATATGRSYGLGKAEILGRIVLPSALPYIGTAIRVAAPTALIVAVVAGLLGGGPGLGQSLLLTQIAGDQSKLFAYVLVLGILGLVVQGLSQWGERRLLHWHPQYRKQVA